MLHKIHSYVAIWLLVSMFLAGAVIRISFFDDSRFLSERQYRSALIARADFLSNRADSSAWRKAIAKTSAARMGILEPPVMESLAVLGYRIIGAEKLWVPRLLATAFWLAGALLLFLLAKRLMDRAAAFYATAYFLFLDLGIQVSISFLPDALMLTLFVGSLLSLVRHEAEPGTRCLLAAGVLSGLCVLVKPLCVFAIAGAFMALRWNRTGMRGLVDWSSIALGLCVLVPASSYYLYGIFVAGFLDGQASASFVPALLVQPDFWKATLRTGLDAVGFVAVVLALLGFAVPQRGAFRPLIIGLLVGHFVFCLVFTYHVRMAGHYHLQLAIPVSLCLGPAVAALVDRVRHGAAPSWVRSVSLAGAAVCVVILAGRNFSEQIRSTSPIVDPMIARSIGELVGHSDRVVYISQYYGMPLEYYGELSGWFWPRASTDVDRARYGEAAPRRSVAERLNNLGGAPARAERDFRPEYFVVTDFREFSFHDDLAEYLEQRCTQLASEPDYLIFGQCRLQ